MIALAGIQRGFAQKFWQVVLENLHGAERPAEALRLQGLVVRGCEPAAEGLVDIAQLVAFFQQAQAQFGVFADAPFGPAAYVLQRLLAHQRHGAVLDQRVALVTVMHAGTEKALEFPVAHAAEEVVLPITMRLRCLHHGDLILCEMRHQHGQPVRRYNVIGIDHADDFCARIGLLQREVQSAGLETRPLRKMEETEVGRQRCHIGFHRFPQCFVLGVVIDDNDFQPGVFQPGKALDSGDHHFRRLVVTSQMHGNEFFARRRQGLRAFVKTAPAALEHDFAELDAIDHQHGRCHQHGNDQAKQNDEIAQRVVIIARQIPGNHQGRDAGLHQQGHRDAAARTPMAETPGNEHDGNESEQGGPGCLADPAAVSRHGAGKRIFQRAVDIEHAPVRACPSFDFDFPRLVDGFHQVIVVILVGGLGEELAHETGLIDLRCDRGADSRPAAGPADFGDDDFFARIGCHQLLVALDGVIDCGFYRHTLMIGQQVYGDEIHMLDQPRVLQPDMPGLCRRDRQPGL